MKLDTRSARNRARQKLRERDGDNCHWCGEPMLFHYPSFSHPQMASIEHLREKWKGGSDKMGNLVLAHLICNQRRNAANPKPMNGKLATILAMQDATREERQ